MMGVQQEWPHMQEVCLQVTRMFADHLVAPRVRVGVIIQLRWQCAGGQRAVLICTARRASGPEMVM